MSHQLISRNPDLKQLRDKGFDVSITSGFLVMRDVPYVNSNREIKLGNLVSELTLAGDKTDRPKTHVVYFSGEFPCDKNGNQLTKIVNDSSENTLAPGLIVQHSFSSKPQEGYSDYYVKMTTYAAMLSGPARVLSPEADARTFPPVPTDQDDSVFNYIDTASSRNTILEATKKLELHKVAILGLGGTGSYILDFVAKTPTHEIHLFDSDDYLTHNAFRSPGAPSLDQLREKPKKVDYFKSIYERMHRGIVAHPYDIDHSNIDELHDMDFVFISIHGGKEKEYIFKKLEEYGVLFVDVGMGLYMVDSTSSIGGILRVTTSTDYKREHVRHKVSFSGDGDNKNEYSTNIQIADLNALNAVFAIIKWKKIFCFYLDLENEHSTVYTIDGNIIDNDDKS